MKLQLLVSRQHGGKLLSKPCCLQALVPSRLLAADFQANDREKQKA